MKIKKANELTREPVKAGTKTYHQVLIGPEEGPNFTMRRFIIESGGGMPRHLNTVEHEQYILNGRAKIGIGDEVFEVERGDVIYIPAEVPHWYKVEANETFEFLCVIPNKPDKTKIIEE